MDIERNNQLNGSSVHSSRSTSPEFEEVGDLPVQGARQIMENSEERSPTPTPHPVVQQQLDAEPIQGAVPLPMNRTLPPLPLAMPIRSRRMSLSPLRHEILSPQQSNSGSSSDVPVPLTPTVHVIHPFPLSGSSSDASFEAFSHLILRLREVRRMNEESRSRSVASGLYEFANMMMPGLPEYEAPIFEDFDAIEELRQRRRREGIRFCCIMGVSAGLIASVVVGQQLSFVYVNWRLGL